MDAGTFPLPLRGQAGGIVCWKMESGCYLGAISSFVAVWLSARSADRTNAHKG